MRAAGRTSHGCLWRRLDNGAFGYNCPHIGEGPEACPCNDEITQLAARLRKA